MMRRSIAVLAAFAMGVALAACTAKSDQALPGSGSPVPTASAEPLLTCDDLVDMADVVDALTGSDGVAPTPVPATRVTTDLRDLVNEAAGGLTCSWRVGEPPFNASDAPSPESRLAYLIIELLPGSDGQTQDDAPNSGTRLGVDEIDGHPVWEDCADGGCWTEATVDEVKVVVTLTFPYWLQGWSRYGEMTADDLLPKTRPVVASTLEAIADAPAERTEWPSIGAVSDGSTCDSAVDPVAIASALGLPEVVWNEHRYDAESPQARVGLYECWQAGANDVSVTVGAGLAPVVAEMATEPDNARAFERVTLEGASQGDIALRSCATDAPRCSVLFTLGVDAYGVGSTIDAVAAAEAIIARSS
ncbi:hypothetical protein [Ruicaihuangia caeni]|uniref:hypothetical protein n=1 Tax=Ruicaihuangia caeni TaxID=3042517 RepID=UPI00338E55C5